MDTNGMIGLLDDVGLPVLNSKPYEARTAVHKPMPEALRPELKALVQKEFPHGLYRHQAEVVRLALEGRNVVVATGTASGKTISFALPAFQMVMDNPDARAIFFYPTKALAGDQLKKFERYADLLGLENMVARFDGDVATAQRPDVLRNARILLCTPDIVHFTMLREADKKLYQDVFRNLKLIIMDECHVYSGAFGSNMAFLLRRIRQVCEKHGNRLQFVCASATSSQPIDHMQKLTGVPFELVGSDLDGSPSGGKCFHMVDTGGEASSVLHDLVLRLTKEQTRFIVFHDTRTATEQNYIDIVNQTADLEQFIKPYRSGYEIADRVAIENALQENRLMGVMSTSALELGVDLPEMEVCILLGLPNTTMSFWQRAGRVGRQPGSVGQVLIILGNTCMDDYYRKHPDEYFSKPYEELVVRLDNWPLIASHFACARYENKSFGDSVMNPAIFGEDFVSLKKKLDNGEIIDDALDNTLNPHAGLSLRGIEDPSYKLQLNEQGDPLGSINWSQILREAYPEAVYRHMGNLYRVQRIRKNDRVVIVKPEDNRNAKTSPVGYLRVTPTQNGNRVFRTTKWGEHLELWHADVNVAFYTSGFREKNGATFIRQQTYDAPLVYRFATEGVFVRLQPSLMAALGKNGGLKPLNTLAHAMANLYLINYPCNLSDIATHSIASHSDGCGYIFIFDTTAGGLGFSEKVYDTFTELLKKSEELLGPIGCTHCDNDAESFDKGCPACIQIPRWIEDNEHLGKADAMRLLKRLYEVLDAERPMAREREIYKLRKGGGLPSIAQNLDNMMEEMPESNGAAVAVLYDIGSRLLMPNGKPVTVRRHEQVDGEWRYEVMSEDGRILRIRDMGLTLVEGMRKKVCPVCGNLCMLLTDVCEECGEGLPAGS